MALFDFLTGADEQSKAIRKATGQAIRYEEAGRDSAINGLQPGANYQPIQSKLYDLVGLNGGQAQQDAYGSYAEGPDVQFQREQAEQAAQRAASAGGRLASGRTLTDAMGYATGLARQGFGDWYSRLRDLYGSALGTAGNIAGIRANSGSRLGDLAMSGGMARAQAEGQRGGAFGNLLSQGMGLAAQAAGAYFGMPGGSGSSYDPGVGPGGKGYTYYGGPR